MANDPMTVDSSEEITLRDGVHMVILVVSGPADYDATDGSLLDVSSYVSTIKHLSFGACTAKADALVLPRYVNSDFTSEATGAVYFTWEDADGSGARVLENVADQTNLSAYQWQVLLVGDPA